MTDTRTAASLRSANAWQALQTLLLTLLIALTIPTAVLSCFALYYGWRASEGLKEWSEKVKQSNTDLEAEVKKINAEVEKERLKQEKELKIKK